MLPRTLSILLVITIQVIFAVGHHFGPAGVLIDKDPDAILQPLGGRPADEDADDAVDGSKVIRGLLDVRQDSCPSGYAVCNDGGRVERNFSRGKTDFD